MSKIYSADISLMFKISQLSERYGLKPSEANAGFQLDHTNELFNIEFEGTVAGKQENFTRMLEALGCVESESLSARDIAELEDIVDRALSQAPRARIRA